MIEFKPDINGDVIIYRAYENGEMTGKTTLTYKKTHADLKCIEAKDDETAEGLIRSALSAAANRDAYSCCYEPQEFRNVAFRLGFSENSGLLSGEIPFLLSGCCGCNVPNGK